MSLWTVLLAVILLVGPVLASEQCRGPGVRLQVLGSGGPELSDQRASSGYLVWQNNSARFLVDAGGGSMLRFEQSGANLSDLEAVFLSHAHVDHSADLPVLIKSSFFTDRSRDLPIYGPTGNRLMPSTTALVNALFARPGGAYRYLSSYIDGEEAYRLIPHDVAADTDQLQTVIDNKGYKVSAAPVYHGPIPALAWRIDLAGKSIVFSGDMNGDNHTLEKLAIHADILVAHHAIPEGAEGVARNLHMPPSVIGRIAAKAQVKRVVLSHRMVRTLGHEDQTLGVIAKHYRGPVVFADDLQCF